MAINLISFLNYFWFAVETFKSSLGVSRSSISEYFIIIIIINIKSFDTVSLCTSFYNHCYAVSS